jgi:murein DD-endopeptidase MepM/ murein hydrolase activator NlpD
MVEIRHANRYASQYLHLSRFARGVRAGSRVRQGEVIAYVGSSGSSTGPHLDYRIQLNGGYVKPAQAAVRAGLAVAGGASAALSNARPWLGEGSWKPLASLRHFYLAEAAARPSNPLPRITRHSEAATNEAYRL